MRGLAWSQPAQQELCPRLPHMQPPARTPTPAEGFRRGWQRGARTAGYTCTQPVSTLSSLWGSPKPAYTGFTRLWQSHTYTSARTTYLPTPGHGRAARTREHKHKKMGAVLVSTDMNRAHLRAQTQAGAVHGSTRANMHQWDHVHRSAKKEVQQCVHACMCVLMHTHRWPPATPPSAFAPAALCSTCAHCSAQWRCHGDAPQHLLPVLRSREPSNPCPGSLPPSSPLCCL